MSGLQRHRTIVYIICPFQIVELVLQLCCPNIIKLKHILLSFLCVCEITCNNIYRTRFSFFHLEGL